MDYELPLLQKLIGHFKKLPGVGEKTAHRLTFAVLDMQGGEVTDFAETLQQVKEKVRFCNRCGNLSEEETCRICNDGSRVEGVLCIVERPSDIYILERSGQYRGRYHVLHGVLSPLDGIGPGELNLSGLKKRVEENYYFSSFSSPSSSSRFSAQTSGRWIVGNLVYRLLKPLVL